MGVFDNLTAARAVAATDGREPFGQWLLAQRDRGDWIDDIAASARLDRSFPKNGDPDEVREHMRAKGADGDVMEALTTGEMDWLCL